MSRNEFEIALDNLFPTESRWFLYCLLGAVAFALSWRFLTAVRRPTVEHPPLTVAEIACLRSWQAPLVATMGLLRAGGHLGADGRTDPARPLPPAADAFTRRLLHRLDGSQFSVNLLLHDQLGALRELEDGLARRGYLRTGAERWRSRCGAVPLLGVTVAGIVCTPLLLLRGAPVDVVLPGFLAPSMFTAVFVLPPLLSVPRTTRAGSRLLAGERSRARYLKPSLRPAFATYGASAVGLSVALFGTAALWQIDPRYAAAMAVAGGTGTDGSGASCGSGFACGGSSCSGGSSGGSSCGGGGGCGGGGCGG
ncbi:TIGR04222 domain-containing membrane protein [Tsukamurella ocularis]|uniref:TIGR04222 domain-containing membrane protein n=1 Tax=Tsukamurella ocularis TaxID=1970234 RepID=UPI0039F0A630